MLDEAIDYLKSLQLQLQVQKWHHISYAQVDYTGRHRSYFPLLHPLLFLFSQLSAYRSASDSPNLNI
jgi:hypothetical protein